MKRGLAVLLVLLASTCPAKAQVAGLSDTILELSGNKRMKIVWGQNWDPDQVYDERKDVYGGANIFKLMGYDTADDTIRVINGELDDYSRPTITSDGERIVYTDRVENKIYVVNWDGSNRRLVVGGLGRRHAGTTWYDPARRIEWVYYVEGEVPASWGDFFWGVVYRINLDPPGQLELVWNQTKASHFLNISSDGARLAGGFPWPDSGAIEPEYNGSGGGTVYHPKTGSYSEGCWPTITPDTRYIVGIFNGTPIGQHHRYWNVWEHPQAEPWELDLHSMPGNEGWEVFHPRMSNHPRFLTVTGPYSNGPMGAVLCAKGGPQIEVYLGKVNAGFSQVTDWVQITVNIRPDIYPHAWVAPDVLPEVHIDAFTATPNVILAGGSTTLSWATRNADSVSIAPGIGGVNASGSMAVSPSTNTTYTLTAQGQGGPKTAQAAVAVVSISLPLAVNCGDGSPAVSGWQDESVFRTGGAEYDFSGAVDLNGQPNPAPASVYLTCVHTGHSYSFPVSDGTYTVRLHFYDGNGSPGRAMDYTLEGIKRLDDFDIADEAGGGEKALVREFTVVVSDGDGLQIVAERDQGNDVFESGIEILEGGIADIEDPVVAITAPTNGETLSGNVTVQGTASDNVAVARVVVSLDGGAWEEAAGTTDWSHTLYKPAFPQDGSHTIKVQATDPTGNSALAQVHVTTHNTPSITITSPVGGEQWQAGSTQAIQWRAENLSDAVILLSVDGGETYPPDLVVAPSLAAHHTEWENYPWLVPNQGTDRARILIRQYNQSSVRDESGLFTIVAVGNPAIELSSPVGGETLTGNSSHPIAFETTDVDTVVVEFSPDGGKSYETIATQSAGDPGWGTVAWTVPNVATTVARVRARTQSGDVADRSGDFTIEPEAVAAGPLEVLRYTFQGVIPRSAGRLESVQVGKTSVPVAEDGSFEAEVEAPAGVSPVIFVIEGASSKGSYRRLVRMEIEDAEPPIGGLSVSAKELREFVGGRSGVLVWVDGGERIRVLDFREKSPEVRLLSEDLNCVNPLLSPDGTRVVYSQGQSNGPKFIVTRALAGGAAESIGTGDVGYWGTAGSPEAIVYCDWSDGPQDGADGATYRQKLAPDGLTPDGTPTKLHDRAMDAGPSGDGTWLGHVYEHLYAYNLASGVEYPTEKFFLMGDGGVANHQTCNGSMAPDGSGRLMCLVIPHDFVRVYSYRTDGDRFEQSSEFRLPAGMAEWGFPEWSTHPQYFTAVLRTSDLKSRLFVVKMAEGDIVPELLKITGEKTDVSYSHLYLEP